MREAYSLVWSVLVSLVRSRVSLEAEILILRHQLNIQGRHLRKRLAFSAMDRLIFVGLYRFAPNSGLLTTSSSCRSASRKGSFSCRPRGVSTMPLPEAAGVSSGSPN